MREGKAQNMLHSVSLKFQKDFQESQLSKCHMLEHQCCGPGNQSESWIVKMRLNASFYQAASHVFLKQTTKILENL